MKPSRLSYSIEQKVTPQLPLARPGIDMGGRCGDNLGAPSLLFAFNADTARGNRADNGEKATRVRAKQACPVKDKNR
jgi:hypothetical protein